MRICLSIAVAVLLAAPALAQSDSGRNDAVRGLIERATRGTQNGNRAGSRPSRTSPIRTGPSLRIGPIRITPGQGGVVVTPAEPREGDRTDRPKTFPITTPGYTGTGGGPELIIDPVPGRPRPIVAPQPPPTYVICPVPEYVPPTVGGEHHRTGRCRIVTVPDPSTGPELPTLEPGQEITLFGENFGSRGGEVLIGVGPMIMRSDVLRWSPTEAVATLPDFPLANEVVTDVAVKRADGVVAHEYQVRLVPKSEAAPELPVVHAGQNLTIAGRDLGDTPGRVALNAGPLELRTTLLSWGPTAAVVALPTMTFRDEVEALLTVVTAEGRVADEIAVRFSPEPAPVEPSVSSRRVGR